MQKYKAGEIAKLAGINIETLRYYERIGIMPEPRRLESRYRYYLDEDLKRLLFIKKAKEIGFSLKEINELLNLKVDSTSTCGDVKRLAEHKLKDVEEKIQNLMKIKKVLIKLIKQCVNEEISSNNCPILEVIENRLK